MSTPPGDTQQGGSEPICPECSTSLTWCTCSRGASATAASSNLLETALQMQGKVGAHVNSLIEQQTKTVVIVHEKTVMHDTVISAAITPMTPAG